MTEAMSRREIEDVLSSIRRIVSHDVHPNASQEQQGPAHDKLLLTSELRVDDAAPALDDAQSASEDQGFATTPAPLADTDTGPVVSQISEVTQEAPDAVPFPTPAQAPTADIEPSVDLSAAPFEEVQAVEAEDLQSDAELQSSLEDSALEATLARLESVLANSVQPSASRTPDARADPSDGELIDEGVLYQIVAHIVRQELQGELGEKITRNIRKLVRSEVARELQLRKF
ncbi:hypothetical protein [Roseinatronobacter monicus]|uniref:Uncharacterized protein n=1 Tax=Roseinatronobacter monicus TaxID=393481 RepID=A0A543KBA3_9RHOB|nr:hypothetical protein [Roseinatronobacter monicus]TQM92334.1 hypothetical protein BD293_0935 [Roseinatronobacter monicus]